MPSKALRKPSNDGGSREESARSDQGSASNKNVPDERSGITESNGRIARSPAKVEIKVRRPLSAAVWRARLERNEQ